MRSPHTTTREQPLLIITRESPRVVTKTEHSQKKKKDSGDCHSSEVSGDSVARVCKDISSKVKDQLLSYNLLPLIEEQCLVGMYGFWRQCSSSVKPPGRCQF